MSKTSIDPMAREPWAKDALSAGRRRRLLMGSTAAAALAVAVVAGGAQNALAVCPVAPATTITGTGSTAGPVAGGPNTALEINGTGTVGVNHDMTSTGSCAIYVNSDNSIIVVGGVTVQGGGTDAGIGIVGDGNNITLNGTTVAGGGTTAIDDFGVGGNSILVGGGATVNGDILMGAGDDTVRLLNGITVNGSIDGGADTDTLVLDGTGTGNFNLGAVSNFEILRKIDTGTANVSGASAFDTVVVLQGILHLDAGATMTVSGTTSTLAGATHQIAGTHTANGTTDIAGTLQVLDGGVYNATVTTNIDGGTLQVDLGGTYDADAAVNGSVNADTIIVNGTFEFDALSFGLGNGNDTIFVGGTFDVNTNGNLLTLGDGDDLVEFSGTPTLSVGLSDGIDAGVGGETTGDVLRFSGATDAAFVGLELVTNFEHLEKTGTNTWTLTAGGVGAEFEDVHVMGGRLVLLGQWSFTGNTTTVDAGTFLDIGDGIVATTVDEAGGADISGTLTVFDLATFNVTLTTTVFSGGNLIVDNGGTLNGADIDVQGGGGATINGLVTAVNTTVAGSMTIGGTGDYQSSGTTTVSGTGLLTVSGGSYDTAGALLVTDSGQILMTTGTFTAQDSVTVSLGGEIIIHGGTFNANAGTTVQDTATLQVLGGNYVATGPILIDGNGQVVVDDLFVPNGVIFANGTTTLQGAGELIVNGGAYNAAGAIDASGLSRITVNDGTVSALSTTTLNNSSTLAVFGPGVYQAADTITVNGGFVIGTGTISGMQLLDNVGGTVSPGAGINSVGTLFFVGTYRQQTAAGFQADLQPGGPADLFDVTGSAELLGNVELFTLAANFAAFEQFRIIATDNPIPTMFETALVSGAGLGSNFAFIARVDDAGVFNEADPSTGNNVDVILAISPAALEGLTPNQQAVADYLGQAAPPGAVFIEEALPFLVLQILAGGPNALDQIGGEVYDSFTTFAFDTARRYGRLVDDRVRTLRCAARSGAANPLCAGLGPTLLADAGPDSIPTPGADSPRGFSPNTHPYGWSVWVSGLGSYLSKDRTSTNLGYSGWTTGGVLGVDLALSKRWIVGLMLGGSKSNIDFSGVGGDGDLSNVGIGVYTAWYGSRWFADASFTYSKNWIEADRILQFGTVNSVAKGKTEGDQYAAHATLGYGFALGGTALELSGGVDWVQLRQYGFTETGAGQLNLTVNSRTDDSLRLRIGVRAAHPVPVRPGLVLVPELRVGYARELLDNTRPITSSFGGIPGTFTVNGDDGSRNIVTFGAGVKAEWSKGVTLSLNYDGEWAGDRQLHGVTGRIHVRW